MHSFWLGALMAVVAGFIIILTKRSTPQLRYKLLTGLLILFILSTFTVFYNTISTEFKRVALRNNAIVLPADEIAQAQNIQKEKGAISVLIAWAQTHAGSIVLLWFIVICFKCVQLISGLRSLHNLKRKNILEAGNYWQLRVNELATQIGIRKTVALLQSSVAKVPMVVGHVKPVILFPIGILNALPQNEVEAILLHELAHIKRNDFLINLLQQLAEIIFFFNPAVLWVSSLIKNERENCCDDIAIAITQDKKIFIHALVAFQEYNAGAAYATAFPGTKNHLLNRVKRIITNNNKTLNNMEKIILASGIIITCFATFAFSPVQAKDKKGSTTTSAEKASTTTEAVANEVTKYQPMEENAANNISSQDTLPQKEITQDSVYNMNFSGTIDGKNIKLKEDNSGIKELYVDGKKIPEDQYGQYQPLIDKLHKQMKENALQLKLNNGQLKQEKQQLQKQTEVMKKETEKMKEQQLLMQKDFSTQQEEMKKQEMIMQQKAELMKKDEAAMKTQSLKMQKDFIQQQEQYKLKQLEFEKKVQDLQLKQIELKKIMLDSIQVKKISLAQPAIKATTLVSVKPVISVEEKSMTATPAITIKPAVVASKVTLTKVEPAVKVIATATAKPVVYVTTSSLSEKIIHDLQEANIISSTNNLSFRLTNDELIVNGVKQPGDIHQKILKKYMTKPGETITFSYSNQQ